MENIQPKLIKKAREVHDLTFYKFAIESLPVAVITVDPELRITGFNSSAEEVTGYSKEETIGQHCDEILKGELCKVNCPLRTVLNHRGSIVRTESTICNKFGEAVPIRQHAAGLLDDDGKLVGGLEAFVDISHSKALEREKANLISMFAHDMKSPVISIQGFILRLLQNSVEIDEEKRKKYLKIVRLEANKLESLIDGFLEYSRLQTGKLNFNFTATSLDKELIEIYETFQDKGFQKGIQFELLNMETLPIIEADSKYLQRVFSNLLDNALKHSREKGLITIATQHTDQYIMVKIKDRGTGIDSKDLPYIFDPFYQGRGEKRGKGYGLGLAVVKAIVDGHGGKIFVESELGKGSVFTVALPKRRKPEE
ncbi:MAG: PAS domain-containing sensor histidine kinase [Syntrophaceae bacterium]|nr:PAS domain-containing sensor histidine kinase [Syntrophaceae bacterium]